MRLIGIYPLAIAILSSAFVFAQGELGAPCQAIADSTNTGSTPSCDSGYCRNGGCSDPSNIVQLGDTCTNDNQCVNAETYAEIPASCAGLPGTSSTCGGAGAFCYTPFGGTTGPSPVCASNVCKNAQCAALNGVPAGGACTSTTECDGYASCLDGTCNDQGFPCTSDDDNTQTGPSAQCSTGYCRNGGCASFPGSTIGQACDSDASCIGVETYSETPAACAGIAGTQATCGGAGAFCYTVLGQFTGESPVCASNICKNGQCAALNGVPAGGACQSNVECEGYANCLDGTCNDQEFPCASDNDNTQTGPSAQCSTGYCRNGGCASFPGSTLGQACSSDASCIGSETYSETPAACAGIAGTQATCGGAGAFCYTIDGQFTGESPVCASNICKNGQCAALNGVSAGGACQSNVECAGYANCLDGTCNDQGFPCVSDDTTQTGTSTQCSTGYCRNGGCASFPGSTLGQACSSDASCVGSETYSETPAACAGIAGTQATCGGAGAFCYTIDGQFTGESPVCASNICKNGQCAAFNGVSAGGACQSNVECAGYANCLDGTCNDQGFPCVSDDATQTGPTSQCSTGYCRNGGCASFPASNFGEPCSSDAACIGAESYSETPAACAGPAGVPATCGGGSAFCYTLEGQFSGFSPICASGQCLNGQCKRVDPVAPGQACQGSFDCGGGIFCVNGFCTGGEDTCAANDANEQAIGNSDDCTSGFCRAGQCSNVPTASLGDICDEDRDCSGFEDNTFYRSLLYCGQAGSSGQRCGSGGAACVDVTGSPSGEAPGLCISGQCLNYACTDVTPTPGLRKRVDFPAQQVIQKRLCPKGFEPCPLYPKGYECVDVMNDIESCGGCVGRNMPGIDCSADVHAAAVSCVGGHCEISTCEMGYVVAAENNTCIAE